MDGFSNMVAGLQGILSLANMGWLFIGVVLGMIVGIFPGLGPTAGIAILLPITIGMDPTAAIIMLAAIYYGSMYGATVTAILINTPGAAAVVASTFDGYPLARAGRAAPALVMQAVASFVGGTVGVIAITFMLPAFGRLARSFGPAEYLLVVTMGLLTLILLLGDQRIKGVISALVGFAIASAGVDLGTGSTRFTFGTAELLSGVNFVPIAIGLFGIGEIFYVMYLGSHRNAYEVLSAKGPATDEQGRRTKPEFWPKWQDYKDSGRAYGMGSVIGFVLGVIPGAGATIASLVAYSVERSLSKMKNLFGKGAMPGLVAPETANNASSAGAMIPLLTLGIPGSASTAVLLGAFILWGLQPGPLLMVQEPAFAWGLIGSMYLGNLMLVAICIAGIPLFAAVLKVPYRILLPNIVVLCAIGAFAVRSSRIELWLALVFGVVGFLMKLYGYSPAATVVALVLAPLAERSLRQTAIVSDGNPLWVWERPIARILIIALVLLVLAKPLSQLFRLALGRTGAGRAASAVVTSVDDFAFSDAGDEGVAGPRGTPTDGPTDPGPGGR